MFRDRVHAGRSLAEELSPEFAGAHDAVVFGIPRGGVVVAAEVARRLKLPLDIVVASKIGAPGNPEYAIGAVDADGAVAQNVYAGYTLSELEVLAHTARDKIDTRMERYHRGPEPPQLAGRTAIVVDDGIATGLTVFAAADYLKRHGAARVVVAAPVVSADTARSMRHRVDAVVALAEPEVFYAVGQFYRHFDQVDDSEVVQLLETRGPY